MRLLPESCAGVTCAINLVCAALLAGLFLGSINSLTSFPDSFGDEGHYAEAGYSLVETGIFTPYDLPHTPAVRAGDGLRPRMPSWLFGEIGRHLGYSLGTARSISFALVWLATVLWLAISRRLGVPPCLGALLIASSERVFWASHAFRPEATLILVNTVLVLMLVSAGRQRPHAAYWPTRGLLNGALVLAHGNGLVSAVLNTLDVVIARIRCSWRSRLRRLVSYGAA